MSHTPPKFRDPEEAAVWAMFMAAAMASRIATGGSFAKAADDALAHYRRRKAGSET